MLVNTSKTGWEIFTDTWKAVRKFNLEEARFAHTSTDICNKYIYSIGGKDEAAAKWVERYEIDEKSERLVELN